MGIESDNIKQLLLSDGSEIICKIEEELEDDLVISSAFKIVRIDTPITGNSYYTFKPFMTYVEDSNHFISLNLYHIVSATVPYSELHNQYVKIMANVKEIMLRQEEEFNEEDVLEESIEDYSNVISIDRSKLH
jgi:hypothetical protein